MRMSGDHWRCLCLVGMVMTASIVIPAAHAETWNGGAGVDDSWATGLNWVGGVAPTAPTTANVITFNNLDSGNISVLDQNRQIGGLNASLTANTFSHILDMNSRELTIAGNVAVGQQNQNYSTFTVQNGGRFQIGTTSTSRNITIASGSDQTSGTHGGTLTISGSTFQGYLGTVTIGNEGGHNGLLDLIGATLDGGLFKASTLSVGINGGGAMAHTGRLRFGTSLTALDVTTALEIGRGQYVNGYVSGATDGSALPANVNITIGSSGSPATVTIGSCDRQGTASLVAGSGGICSAYVSTLVVGRKYNAADAATWNTTGTLNLSSMQSITLDVSGDCIVGQNEDTNADSKNSQAYGYLYLPPGTASFANLYVCYSIGGYSARANGTVRFYGTQAAVSGAVSVGGKGIITTYVSGSSCGLDLATAATLAVSTGGKLDLQFQSFSGGAPIWGLRWAGDHVAELNALGVKLTTTVSAPYNTGTRVAIYKDATHSYVAMHPAFDTGGTLTWNGSSGDSWLTDANWTDGSGNHYAPLASYPAATMVDSVTFGAADSGGVHVLDQDRVVGNLMVSGANATHTSDLNGQRLTVEGTLTVAGEDVTSRLVVNNGTLQVGTALQSRDINVIGPLFSADSSGQYYGTLDINASFEGYLGTVRRRQ